jgi:putative transposase
VPLDLPAPKATTCKAFDKRHGRVGHVFQARFEALLVQKDSYFLEVCRYVVLNPVRAKTVRHPRQWKWTSYDATVRIVQPYGYLTVDETLSHFGQCKANAKKIFRVCFGRNRQPFNLGLCARAEPAGSRKIC